MDIKTNFTLYMHSRDLHQSLIKRKGVCVIGIHCLNIYVSILINKNVDVSFIVAILLRILYIYTEPYRCVLLTCITKYNKS